MANKEEILKEAKNFAKSLKNDFADDLEYNRERGNYKYEITPGDIQSSFMKGVDFVLSKITD